MRNHRTRNILVLASLVLATGVAAQGIRGGGFRGRGPGEVRDGLPEKRTGFSFCRLFYQSIRREAGGQGWWTDYPNGDNNFSERLEELTKTPISRWADGQAGYAVLAATDPRLFQCPFLFGSDIGTAAFTDLEIQKLREYLMKGGFLWVDDFWGDYAWEHWQSQIKQILPEYLIIPITTSHELFHMVYEVPKLPQIPSISFWRGSGGATSERGYESEMPDLFGIFDDKGRIMVLMTHDTDIADGWERETEDTRFFEAFSPSSYGFGINVAVWALSH